MYLLHEYKYSRVLLWNIFLKVDTVQFMSPFFPLLMIGDVVLIMAAGFAAEELRRRLAGSIRRLIESDGGGVRGRRAAAQTYRQQLSISRHFVI